jgi:hypothetical protein
MDWGLVVLLIVIIGAVTSTIQVAINARAQRAAALPAVASGVDEEVRALKERVAVLERLATDRPLALEHEIERLRDR